VRPQELHLCVRAAIGGAAPGVRSASGEMLTATLQEGAQT